MENKEQVVNRKVDELIKLFHSGRLNEVEKKCNEILIQDPNNSVVLNILAVCFKQQGKLNKSLICLDRLVTHSSDNAEAHNNRGTVLKELGNVNEAKESYKKAIILNPNYAQAYNNLANIYSMVGSNQNAINNYKKAIVLIPNYSEAYNNLANTLREIGHLQEAKIEYYNAIKFNPNLIEAYLSISSIKKYKKNDKLISSMLALYENQEIDKHSRMLLCFSLAKVYEDLNKPEKLFKYLDEGNRLKRKQLPYNPKNDIKLFNFIKQIFSDETIKVTTSDNCDKQPIFIVGMPRSGTSLVEQILSSHSSVHGCGELEILNNIFKPKLNANINNLNKGKINIDVDDFCNIFNEEIQKLDIKKTIFTDKMPTNFLYIGFIISLLPHAKIIHVTRNPIATAFSIYKHNFISKGNRYAYTQKEIANFFRLYQDLMSFWNKTYPGKIHNLNYEKLTENQKEETKKLLDYCDLGWEENCLNFYKNERAVKTASTLQVRKKMYRGSSEVWKKYKKYLQPMIKILNSNKNDKKNILIKATLPTNFL
jgi:tetratricopeptide (TPR) repeat protein